MIVFFIELFNDDGDIEDDNTSQAFGDHSPLLASWKRDRFLAMYGLWMFLASWKHDRFLAMYGLWIFLASWKHDRFLAMYGLWIFELRHGGFISYVRFCMHSLIMKVHTIIANLMEVAIGQW